MRAVRKIHVTSLLHASCCTVSAIRQVLHIGDPKHHLQRGKSLSTQRILLLWRDQMLPVYTALSWTCQALGSANCLSPANWEKELRSHQGTKHRLLRSKPHCAQWGFFLCGVCLWCALSNLLTAHLFPPHLVRRPLLCDGQTELASLIACLSSKLYQRKTIQYPSDF